MAVSCRVSGGLCPQPGEGEADPCPGRRRPEAEVPPAGRARQVLGRGCGPARVGQVPVERCCLADCPPPPLLPTPVPAIRPPKRRGPHCSQRRPEMKTALLLLVALAVAAGPGERLDEGAGVAVGSTGQWARHWKPGVIDRSLQVALRIS